MNLNIEYVQESCPTSDCGIVFFVSLSYQQKRREDHQWFYCPNGHMIHYTGKTDAQKLRELKQEKDFEIADLQRQLREAQKPKPKPRKKRAVKRVKP